MFGQIQLSVHSAEAMSQCRLSNATHFELSLELSKVQTFENFVYIEAIEVLLKKFEACESFQAFTKRE